jgi:V-containing nitrogenase delta subunit
MTVQNSVESSVEELTTYIQERCLWQFHSRSWDREDNITGVLKLTADLLTDTHIVLETDADKCNYADAKLLVADIKSKLPAIYSLGNEEKKAVLEAVKDRLIDITITKSLNGELHHPNY